MAWLGAERGRGFTLLELMVVVAIVGILASVAIPTFGRYIRKSKTSEASLNLRKIYDGEVAYFYEEHTTPTGAAIKSQFVYCMPVPAHPPTKDKRRGDFGNYGWPEIKFSPDGPIYFIYHAQAHPAPPHQPANFPRVPPLPIPPSVVAGFAARAQGNLDGDDDWSFWERIAGVDSSSGELEGGSGIFTIDELE